MLLKTEGLHSDKAGPKAARGFGQGCTNVSLAVMQSEPEGANEAPF